MLITQIPEVRSKMKNNQLIFRNLTPPSFQRPNALPC